MITAATIKAFQVFGIAMQVRDTAGTLETPYYGPGGPGSERPRGRGVHSHG